MSQGNLRDAIQRKYGAAARQATAGKVASWRGCGELPCCDPVTRDLYDSSQQEALPPDALAASLGCGNPSVLAELQPGEMVLDLGSGGGIDVLLSARQVGPAGKVYGLDLTEEMLALARENLRKSGLGNVEFLAGAMEDIPLPDNSIDVIISNCVINLSADKDRVLREAFRVLKPGGRLVVSDIVVRGDVPREIRSSMELWVGCIAGALEEYDYRDKLFQAGFQSIDIEPTRIYRSEDAREFLTAGGIDADQAAPLIDGKFSSAVVRAIKPLTRGNVVGPSCRG
jgi:arsenite methyltransferase